MSVWDCDGAGRTPTTTRPMLGKAARGPLIGMVLMYVVPQLGLPAQGPTPSPGKAAPSVQPSGPQAPGRAVAISLMVTTGIICTADVNCPVSLLFHRQRQTRKVFSCTVSFWIVLPGSPCFAASELHPLIARPCVRILNCQSFDYGCI